MLQQGYEEKCQEYFDTVQQKQATSHHNTNSARTTLLL
jgi:hypothetical protein